MELVNAFNDFFLLKLRSTIQVLYTNKRVIYYYVTLTKNTIQISHIYF